MEEERPRARVHVPLCVYESREGCLAAHLPFAPPPLSRLAELRDIVACLRMKESRLRSIRRNALVLIVLLLARCPVYLLCMSLPDRVPECLQGLQVSVLKLRLAFGSFVVSLETRAFLHRKLMYVVVI